MSTRDNPYKAAGMTTASVDFGTPEHNKSQAQPSVLNLDGNTTAGELIKETSTASFSADVIQESRRQPVLVDFWAPWCGPCKQLTPLLEQAVRQAGGKVRLVKMNIDEHPAIAGQLGIQSIPAVIAFKDGQPVDGFMGAVPESQIKQFIDKLGGDGGDRIGEALEAAKAAISEGDSQTGAHIYSAILQEEPEQVDALAGLAGLLFDAGQTDKAAALLDRVPAAKSDASAVAAIRARMALAEQVAALGDPEALAARLEANPADHQARFDLALIANARGRREEAAERLLHIIRTDRSWNDDGARAKLLELFDAWGPADPATLSARRRLSSLLFS
ncbi:thioredoxin [Nitratireductor luteus]|uniref:thioredoxin n=1 Tax=Nitratireductor luteus TaxID=2976980 RepID=UPI00223EF501|nr:thioredoxin [Nitratireductor luteus]